jgi:dTDP-4-amino-4,6-dideoxygalactose transaminase
MWQCASHFRACLYVIQVFQPDVGDAELAAVERVFRSNWLGTGPMVEEFERAFGTLIGRAASELRAVSSGTEGLFHLMAALGLGPGDDVVLPTISFIGAAHAVRHTGARVVLCDVDPCTFNPTVEVVEQALTPATKAIVILHFGGDPGDVVRIAALARERRILLVEDAAVGLGSSADGSACGTLGDAGLWSFDAMKVLTTGDGGMVWCRDSGAMERLCRSTRLGLGPTGFVSRTASSRWWEVDPSAVGRRGTMNDVCASIGLVQLSRLSSSLRRRAEIALAYDKNLRDVPWLEIHRPETDNAARTFYWLRTAPGVRDCLAAHLLEQDVYTTFKYWPLHRTSMYGSDGQAFAGADRAAASTLLLPLHQGLSNTDVDRVLDAVRTFRP